MIFESKDKYVGQLHNNERHGEGKYYMASGDRIEGILITSTIHLKITATYRRVGAQQKCGAS